MKKLLIVVLVLAMVAGTAFASGAGESSASAGKKEVTIGVVTKIVDPFFQKLAEGCMARGEELGVKIVWKAASNSTAIEEQINIIEDLIVSGVDGLIIVPIDSKALVPVAVKAMEQGIKVANFDNKFDTATVKAAGVDYIPFIGIDNEQAAYLSTKYMCEALKGKNAIGAICEGVRGADNATLRANGAKRAFDEYGIPVVASQPGNFVTDTAYAAFANVFQAHPEITAVFAAGDLMALGVYQAAEEAGIAKQVTIAGFDCDTPNLINIKEGKQLCDLDQNPGAISAKAVDVVMDMLAGKKVDEVYSVDPIVVDINNVDKYL